MKKEPVLFVGGIADGKFIDVAESVQFYKYAASEDGKVFDIEYRRERMRFGERAFCIFVGPGISMREAVEMLISNYRYAG